MTKKKCVFFDLGGVLYTLDVESVLKGLSECSGRLISEVKSVLFSPELYEEFESGSISSTQFYETIKKRLRCEINFVRFKSIWNSLLVKRDDMFRMVLDIGKSIDLSVLSNTNEINAEILVRDLKGIIKDVVFSFEVGCMKPDHRIFRIALDRANLKPESVLFIDDREENVNAARHLGIDSHLFKNPGGLVDFLGAYGVEAHGL